MTRETKPPGPVHRPTLSLSQVHQGAREPHLTVHGLTVPVTALRQSPVGTETLWEPVGGTAGTAGTAGAGTVTAAAGDRNASLGRPGSETFQKRERGVVSNYLY